MKKNVVIEDSIINKEKIPSHRYNRTERNSINSVTHKTDLKSNRTIITTQPDSVRGVLELNNNLEAEKQKYNFYNSESSYIGNLYCILLNKNKDVVFCFNINRCKFTQINYY